MCRSFNAVTCFVFDDNSFLNCFFWFNLGNFSGNSANQLSRSGPDHFEAASGHISVHRRIRTLLPKHANPSNHFRKFNPLKSFSFLLLKFVNWNLFAYFRCLNAWNIYLSLTQLLLISWWLNCKIKYSGCDAVIL
jgi:hypothetical protein